MLKNVLAALAKVLPNPSQAGSLFRTGLQIGGTYLATKGYVDGDTWATVAGPLLILVTTAYGSLYKRTSTNLVASAANVPGVQITAPAEIANAIPSPKVVPAS
jgi:hypothetical protein